MKPHFRLGVFTFALVTCACGTPEDPLVESAETPNLCEGLHSAHIVSPVDIAAEVNPSTPMVVRWSGIPMDEIPDAFTSMKFGTYFELMGPSKTEKNGSTERYSYDLKPNTTHTFEIGWYCFDNGGPKKVVLDTITFTTGP